MSERVKKYLGLSGIVLLLTASYSIVKFVNLYNSSIQPSSFRSFSVSAEGKWASIPDIAKFTYSVITEGGKNIKDLTDKNNTKSDDINKFLEGSKIEKVDIKTISYSVEPRTQYYSCATDINGVIKSCPPSEIVGYTIRQTTEVKVRDFSAIGDILNGVVVKGATSVSDLQFTTDDPAKVEGLARTDAIKKAIEKAEGIASAGGFTVGRLLSIEESNYPSMPYYGGYGVSMKIQDTAAAPIAPIQPGSEETKVNVTLRYEIK